MRRVESKQRSGLPPTWPHQEKSSQGPESRSDRREIFSFLHRTTGLVSYLYHCTLVSLVIVSCVILNIPDNEQMAADESARGSVRLAMITVDCVITGNHRSQSQLSTHNPSPPQ